MMKAVRSTGNRTTELRFISILRDNQMKGWRRKSRIYGKPDFVFGKKKIAIFIDGCFWHGHSCRNLTPASNVQFWKSKLERTRNRDKVVNATLKKMGWMVLRIWECQLKDENEVKGFIKGLKNAIL